MDISRFKIELGCSFKQSDFYHNFAPNLFLHEHTPSEILVGYPASAPYWLLCNSSGGPHSKWLSLSLSLSSSLYLSFVRMYMQFLPRFWLDIQLLLPTDSSATPLGALTLNGSHTHKDAERERFQNNFSLG